MSPQKERPIIFSGNMVQAILNGSKSQTRRVIKPQPEANAQFYPNALDKSKWWFEQANRRPSVKCPYGQVGDRLWVKESYAHYGDELNCGIWKALVVYKADKAKREIPFAHTIPPKEKWWNTGKPLDYFQPSIHMPRWASRITLEITEVRVERVQEITYADIKAEGIMEIASAGSWGDKFIELWDSLNAKRGYGWSENPWVWVISFKLVNISTTNV